MNELVAIRYLIVFKKFQIFPFCYLSLRDKTMYQDYFIHLLMIQLSNLIRIPFSKYE